MNRWVMVIVIILLTYTAIVNLQCNVPCHSKLSACEADLALKRPEWISCQIELNECKDERALLLEGLPERDTYGR